MLNLLVALATLVIADGAFAAQNVDVPRASGHAALRNAPAEIRDLVRAASEAEIQKLGSSSGQVARYLMALDDSGDAVRASARHTLKTYFHASPLLGPPALLGATAGQVDCQAELEGRGFALKHDLHKFDREWRQAVHSLFPPGKRADDFHHHQTKPFSTSNLRAAFDLAEATGLRGEMITVLQLMLIFERDRDLVRSVSALREDAVLAKIGTYLIARWYLDPAEKFRVMSTTLNAGLDALRHITDRVVRADAELLIGDLIEEFLSPSFQDQMRAHFTENPDYAKHYLIQTIGELKAAASAAGRIRYVYRSEVYRGYPTSVVVGRLQTERTKLAVRKLMSYVDTNDLSEMFGDGLKLLNKALGETEKLRHHAAEALLAHDQDLAIQLFAAAGDLAGVRRHFGDRPDGSSAQVDQISTIIDQLANDELIEEFIQFLRTDNSGWAASFAETHWKNSKIDSFPATPTDEIESLFSWYQTSPVSPKRSRDSSSRALIESARKSMASESFGNAAGDAIKAAFLHADGR